MSGKRAKRLRRSIEGYKGDISKRGYYKNRVTGQVTTDKVRRDYQHAKKSNI